ncbi:MAG: homoserine dehydrogenase [Fastidiosipilaceae bacterium]|jgi:homoserine dehydrogenase|nr:homoserine dehydrogenase [Clostridiaceae bacterium]
MNVAILGYGVVGSGVAKVIADCATGSCLNYVKDLAVTAIVDIREFPDDPYADIITKDAAKVFADPSIDIVVETIGGATIAYEYTKQALTAGKHVVTSNKELVALHGAELLEIAAEKNVRYLYEASVGGGIPIIRSLRRDLAGNRIERVSGIVNGTTNFILDRMEHGGIPFGQALTEAQELGYAEQDPAADVDGIDARRKLAILASLLMEEDIPDDIIYTEGIRHLQSVDTTIANRLGYKLKLIAAMTRDSEDRMTLIVAPHLVGETHPLASVHGVFNAIYVTGNAIGDAMFYGQGAGTLPTASAVVADIIEIATVPYHEACVERWLPLETDRLILHEEAQVHAFIRLSSAIADRVISALAAYEPRTVITENNSQAIEVGRSVFMSEGALAKCLEEAGVSTDDYAVLRILPL